jgi:hypothetical protein
MAQYNRCIRCSCSRKRLSKREYCYDCERSSLADKALKSMVQRMLTLNWEGLFQDAQDIVKDLKSIKSELGV